MSAKQQLHAAPFSGALLGAGVIGALCGSWAGFTVARAGLLIAGALAGDIRR